MTDLSAIVSSAFWRVNPPDADPVETREWLEAFDALVATEGRERATFLLRKLLDHARVRRVPLPPVLNTPYKNSITLAHQPQFPGNLELEQRISSIVRWNALAMVVRANRAHAELGGHIASYASAADLFEVGFNHFFRAEDLVYFQPHSAPGVYARAFLEGRLPEERLAHYRQETAGKGLTSYCHPYLMPEFWQFPTGSMGLGPISAIYQARFMRYLTDRGILATAGRKVWAFVGDGEMDEPESLAGLSLAAREGLDNLIFVVNCNLQRLDGPVRGNGSVVQELEGLFAGAGWHVLKLLWGSDWDPLFARDEEGVLLKRLHETVDGEFQMYAATDGRFNREHFFNKYPELRELIAGMSDADIDRLHRGGHDPVKIYAAYRAALQHQGQPTVADEARTFGMQTLFRQFGIYSSLGQLYEPEDHEELLYYREAQDGQILEEGITEAGAVSSWLAAATAYSAHGTPMLPFYIYYSMFGFQRIGDLIWAAADSRARGFLVGGTAGRTTLAGEGLQHQDGSSHLAASTIPNCCAYDPCRGYELATIVEGGPRRMLEAQEDVFYYVTVANENYPHPAAPQGATEGIPRGMYRLREGSQLQLLGSGPILREVIGAAELLHKDWNISAAVWSVTSFTELRRDGMRVERERRFGRKGTSWVEQCLAPTKGPVVAASDYVRAVADLIRPYLGEKSARAYVDLGTGGSRRSDP